jgi:hypothetical protein
MARARKITAILALPEEQARAGLSAIGLLPVSVVHGYLATATKPPR